MKKQKSTALTITIGVAVTVVLYVIFQLLIALAAVRSVLPENKIAVLQLGACGLCVLAGAMYALRRTSVGPLSASMLVAGSFALLQILVGFLVFDHVDWTGQGGGLLLSGICGGLLAGFLGLKIGKKSKKKGRGLHRKP